MGSSPQAAPPQPTAACPWERFLDGAINVSSDDEPDNDDDPDNARARVGEPGNVDGKPGNVDEEDDEDGHERKRARVGTAADRWAERCTVEAIQADQRKGCTGACGCVARLSLDEIRRNCRLRTMTTSYVTITSLQHQRLSAIFGYHPNICTPQW